MTSNDNLPKRAHSRWLILALAMLVAGCASAPATLPTAERNAVKTILPVSLAGHRLKQQYVGVTVFGNEAAVVDVAPLGLDNLYEDQLAAVAAMVPGLTVRRAAVDREPLYRIYDLNGPWDAPAFRTPKWDATAETFRALAKQNNVDALLLVRGRTGGDFIGMSNQSVSGLGLYARGMGNLTTASSAYLLADVWIIDGRTGQPMAGVLLSSGHPSFMGGPLERGVPRAAVGSELTRKPYGQYTDREREQLRSVLVALPQSAWGPTIDKLFANEAK